MYYTYILQSEKDGRYYYGSTSKMALRLKSHNSGKVRSTKHRRPLTLIYYETFPEKQSALKRERFFKSVNGYRWLKSQGCQRHWKLIQIRHYKLIHRWS